MIKYISAIALIGMALTLGNNVLKPITPTSLKPSISATQLIKSQQAQKVLIFVTSPTCELCVSVENAIQQGAAKGWEVHRVRHYPGTFGTPNLIKVVNGHETGRLEGGPRSFDEVRAFLDG